MNKEKYILNDKKEYPLTINRIINYRIRLINILGKITALFAFMFFSLTILQVISRLLDIKIYWIWESLRVLLIWSLTAGACAASLRDGHFRVNLSSSSLTGIANPDYYEVFRQLLILIFLLLLFIVTIPTIQKTKMHKMATLPLDERIFRIGFLVTIGGMFFGHLWCFIESYLKVLSIKKLWRT